MYTLLPPGSSFRDCTCARIENQASIHHLLWVVVVCKIGLPNVFEVSVKEHVFVFVLSPLFLNPRLSVLARVGAGVGVGVGAGAGRAGQGCVQK